MLTYHLRSHPTKQETSTIFAEAMEVDGAIILLDQAKAYDKADHHYLWKVL